MPEYKFNPEEAFNTISAHWKQWDKSVHPKCYVVGISGGKDSTVVAALASKIFGVDNVLGVMMPCGEQKDIADSVRVCDSIGIKGITCNIGRAYEEMLDVVTFDALSPLGISDASGDTKINMPARLRMTMLYAIAQSVGGIVLNTSNLSENMVSYATLYGDHAGSYGPIQGLTVTEIMQLGDWLELPRDLVHKTPVDGLQPSTDEERLGFTYSKLDRFIRLDEGDDEFKAKVLGKFQSGMFKIDIVRIPGPDFDYLGNFVRYNNLPDVRANKGKD